MTEWRRSARDVGASMERAGLRGRFVRLNEAFLREKANRPNDPRHVFYKAMLENDTYEDYAAAVEGISVSVETYRSGPIDGSMEIRYARKRGWIADVGKAEATVLPPAFGSVSSRHLLPGPSSRQPPEQAIGSIAATSPGMPEGSLCQSHTTSATPARRVRPEPASASLAAEGAHFPLERHLRDFLATNLHMVEIEGRRPRLYKDESGRSGVEYQTAVGPIDILAIDDMGALYVFELKRAESFDHAMGQVLRYMGCIKQTIGKGKDVYGVIVARSISEKLKFARTIVPDVYLFEYGISLSLRQAHDLDGT